MLIYGFFRPIFGIYRYLEKYFLGFVSIFPRVLGSRKTMPLSVFLYCLSLKKRDLRVIFDFLVKSSLLTGLALLIVASHTSGYSKSLSLNVTATSQQRFDNFPMFNPFTLGPGVGSSNLDVIFGDKLIF